MVDLPEADRPVNQIVAPFCPRSSLRSLRVRPACQVMLLARASALALARVFREGEFPENSRPQSYTHVAMVAI